MLQGADRAEGLLHQAESLLRGAGLGTAVDRLRAKRETLHAEASLLRAEGLFSARHFDSVFPLGVVPALAFVATARALFDSLLAGDLAASEAAGSVHVAEIQHAASTVVEMLGEALRRLLARTDEHLARLDRQLREAEEGRAAARASMGEEAWRSQFQSPGWQGPSAPAQARRGVHDEFTALLRLRGDLESALPGPAPAPL